MRGGLLDKLVTPGWINATGIFWWIEGHILEFKIKFLINNQSQFLLKVSLHRETCPWLHPEVLQHWHWAEHQDSRANCVPRVWVIRDKKQQQQWRRSCQLPWGQLWGSHQGWTESVHWQWWKQEVSQNTVLRDFLNIFSDQVWRRFMERFMQYLWMWTKWIDLLYTKTLYWICWGWR